MQVSFVQSHNHMQNEISDLIKDPQLTNKTTETFLHVHNSGIYGMTCESDSISLTKKRFWAGLHNKRWTRCLSDGSNEHQVDSARMATIHTTYPCIAWRQCFWTREAYCPQSLLSLTFTIFNVWKHEGNSQPCELEDILVAHLRLFEGNSHFDGAAKGLHKILLFLNRMR
jgi:hypothetical protein